MDFTWIWDSFILIIAAMILLRIAGRKSIAQMSVVTTVIIISIGTTIVQPIANHNIYKAVGSAAIFIATLLIIEYLQVKFNWFEKIMTGTSKIVIENGHIIHENLRSLRMTVDQLELKLREKGISNITDVKNATMETNGQLGYELMHHARPVTNGDLEKWLGLKQGEDPNMLFQEVIQNHNTESVDSRWQ